MIKTWRMAIGGHLIVSSETKREDKKDRTSRHGDAPGNRFSTEYRLCPSLFKSTGRLLFERPIKRVYFL
jgi:hypothetical protein